MKSLYQIKDKDLTLRSLAHRDIESLRNWRNDSRLSQYLSDISYITPEMQEVWFAQYLENETELVLAIEIEEKSHKELLGSVALSDLDGKKGECGKFMIGNTAYKGQGYAGRSLKMCLKIAFEQLHLQTCIAHAHPLNAPSFVTYVNAGFRIIGSRPFKEDGFEYTLEMTDKTYNRIYR